MPIRLLAMAGVLIAAVLGWLLYPSNDLDWPITNDHPQGDVIVAFGDSLTYGHGADRDQDYPAHLGKRLGTQIINEGQNGDTTHAALSRVKGVLRHDPAVVIITLGGNDVLRKVPRDETVANLREIFEQLQASGAMVVYAAVDPPLVSGRRSQSTKDLCREEGVVYVESILDGMWADPDLMSDAIHPNGDGYAIVAERIQARLVGHYE